MTEEEKDLFKMLFLTARKQCVSTQSESESETSTKKSTERFNSKESLFDMLTESSNMTMMNLFQQEQDESLRHQDESLKLQKDSKSKSFSLKMISQQQYEFKMMNMRLEIMKLEVQKLTNQKKLTERDISFQFSTLISNESSVSIY